MSGAKGGQGGKGGGKGGKNAGREPWRIVEASFVAAAQAPGQLPPPLGVELAFAGRSNVGKSSLMNKLMDRRKLVRTSSTPGCTRQINFFQAAARDGAVFRLVDLPGYGYAKRSKTERKQWGQLIEGYLAEREWLRAVAVLVDARRGLEDDDRQLLDFVEARPDGPNKPFAMVVATKIDKLKKSQRKSALARVQREAGRRVWGVSAETGDGVGALWGALRKAAHIVPPAAADGDLDPQVAVP